MEQKWNERYKDPAFAYGKTPNLFFEEWLPRYSPGHILMPADGEGRNGVFAATAGWQVTSFDLSAEGRSKALRLAAENGVQLDYIVADFARLHFAAGTFDAIGLIYAHFPASQKQLFHQKLDACLKPGGIIILEAFAKDHLQFVKENPQVGGPKDVEELYSEAEVRRDFRQYDILLLEQAVVTLSEGVYHRGTGAVIRFVGRKKPDV